MVGRRLHANQGRMASDRSSGRVVVVLAAAGLDYELRSEVVANLEGQVGAIEMRMEEILRGPKSVSLRMARS